MIKGVVSAVSSNPYKDTTLWSFRLENDDNWYRTGEKQPPVKKGQTVEFEAQRKGQGLHVDLKTVTVLSEGAASSSSDTKPKEDWNARTSYWDAKEERDILDFNNQSPRQMVIQRQAARNAALTFMQLLASEGALPIPKTAKPADKLGLMEEMLRNHSIYFMDVLTDDDYWTIDPYDVATKEEEVDADVPQ